MVVGWGNTPIEPSFGGSNDAASVKGKLVNLISSVRTLMRSEFALTIQFAQVSGAMWSDAGNVCFLWWKLVFALEELEEDCCWFMGLGMVGMTEKVC